MDDELKRANEWPIVICGPMDSSFLYDDDGQTYVISSNATAYPVRELSRCARYFVGRPVFFRHTRGGDVSRSRFVVGDVGRVGRLTKAWWEPATNELRGLLSVSSAYWLEAFQERQKRLDYGFSWDVDALTATSMGLGIVDKIVAVYSVDMVEASSFPACGGRFLDAPPLTEELLWAARAHYAAVCEERMNNGT